MDWLLILTTSVLTATAFHLKKGAQVSFIIMSLLAWTCCFYVVTSLNLLQLALSLGFASLSGTILLTQVIPVFPKTTVQLGLISAAFILLLNQVSGGITWL